MLSKHRKAFEEDLRQALPTHEPAGCYEETVRTEALIAIRPWGSRPGSIWNNMGASFADEVSFKSASFIGGVRFLPDKRWPSAEGPPVQA
ncbi:hypothetical protein [Streptomyces sp. NPDC055299]